MIYSSFSLEFQEARKQEKRGEKNEDHSALKEKKKRKFSTCSS